MKQTYSFNGLLVALLALVLATFVLQRAEAQSYGVIASYTFPDTNLGVATATTTASGTSDLKDASDNSEGTVTYSKIGGYSSNGQTQYWQVSSSGTYYHKLASDQSYIELILTSGNFEANDKVVATMYDANSHTDGFYFNSREGHSATVSNNGSERKLEYNLQNGDYSGGTLKLYRYGKNCFVNTVQVLDRNTNNVKAQFSFDNAPLVTATTMKSCSNVVGTGCKVDYNNVGGDNVGGDNGFAMLANTVANNATVYTYYHKMNAADSYVTLKLDQGSFQAGDVLKATMYSSTTPTTGFKMASGADATVKYDASGFVVLTYTLTGDDIDTNGHLKLSRYDASVRVRSIWVERWPEGTLLGFSMPQEPTNENFAGTGNKIIDQKNETSYDYSWAKEGNVCQGTPGGKVNWFEIGGYVDNNSATTDNYRIAGDNYFYHRMSSESSFFKLILPGGQRFQAGDILNANFYTNSGNSQGFSISRSNNLAAAAAISGGGNGTLTYTLTENDIRADGSILLNRSTDKLYIKDIWVTRSGKTPKTYFTQIVQGVKLSEGEKVHDYLSSDNGTGTITFSSSDENVIKVENVPDETGCKLIPHKVGKAYVTANVAAADEYSASSATCVVYVLSDGDGSVENPFTPTDIRYFAEQRAEGNTWDGIDNTTAEVEGMKRYTKPYWVKGYLVGYHLLKDNEVTIANANNVNNKNIDVKANVALANTVGETNGEMCMLAQLVNTLASGLYKYEPYGGEKYVRRHLNLNNGTYRNELFGKEIWMYGVPESFENTRQTISGMWNTAQYGTEKITIGSTGYASFSNLCSQYGAKVSNAHQMELVFAKSYAATTCNRGSHQVGLTEVTKTVDGVTYHGLVPDNTGLVLYAEGGGNFVMHPMEGESSGTGYYPTIASNYLRECVNGTTINQNSEGDNKQYQYYILWNENGQAVFAPSKSGNLAPRKAYLDVS